MTVAFFSLSSYINYLMPSFALVALGIYLQNRIHKKYFH